MTEDAVPSIEIAHPYCRLLCHLPRNCGAVDRSRSGVPHPQSCPRQVSQRPPTRPATTLKGGLTLHAKVELHPVRRSYSAPTAGIRFIGGIYSPALASNQTHEIGATFTPAHAVNQGNGAVGCFESGLEHERAFTITTRDCGILLRCDLPVPVFRTAEESSKACCGIETRQGKPVDRPVSAYHCGTLAIPDKRVILDESRHVCSKFESLIANG